ncbi:MAG: alginate lyase family protein [Phycisphaerae bacterium]|nr:alginate lyase family protein [Phycisphaerae bacterium]
MPVARILNGNGHAAPVCAAAVGDHLPPTGALGSSITEPWHDAAVAKARALLRHQINLFDAEDLYLGAEIDWNYEYKAEKQAPTGFAPAIDYRDYDLTGDAKWVWELSRHHHLVAFGRAYRLTGDERYAREAAAQLQGWMEQCPFGMGMNWRSPLELAIRLINWVWTLELIRPATVVSDGLFERVLGAAYRHLWEISRKYSRFSSANNHLVGEAAGVFIGSSYFACLKDAPRWRSRSRDILLQQMIEQSNSDGGHREMAMGYHLFVLQFFLLAGLCARNTGEDFPAEYWSRLEKMFEFAGAFAEGGGAAPMFGDCDDGYVLDLGEPLSDVHPLMAIAAVLFNRPDFKALSRGLSEPVFWLFGRRGCERIRQVDAGTARTTIHSRAFPESGFYLLQCGHRDEPDRISVAFDCGPLGFESIAAHGHADALSFTLRAFGKDLIVDAGTYDYFTHPAWRDYFRSTRAHNTIVIDGEEQSEILGPFLWGRRARARCLRWESSNDADVVVGEHDGYTRLDDPVVHRRTIRLNKREREVLIGDEILARAHHDLSMYWHLAEDCHVTPLGENRFRIDCGSGTVDLAFDTRLTISTAVGGTDPIAGWVSRGYHHKMPTTTFVGRLAAKGAEMITTRISLPPA